MPISFECPYCQKKMKAPDHAAGRKVKCLGCGDAVQVPEEDEPQVAVVAAPPKRPRSAPPPLEEPRSAPPAKKRRPEPPPEDEEPPAAAGEEEEDEPRPKRRKKKKAKKSGGGVGLVLLLVLGIGGLVLLLGGGGVVAYLLLSGGVGGSWMTYLPDNCQSITSTRCDLMRSSSLYQEVKKAAPNAANSEETRIGRFGLAFNDVARFVEARDGAETVTIVETTRPMTAAEILRTKPGYTESKAGGYSLYTQGDDAFCLPSGSVVLFGKGATVAKILARGKQPQFSPNLQKAMQAVNFGKTQVSVSDGAQRITAAPGMFGPPPGVAGDASADATAVETDIGADVASTTTLLCKSPEAAAALKTKLDQQMQLAQGMAGLVDPDLGQALKNMQITVSGAQVKMSMTLKGEVVVRMVQKFAK